MSFTIWLQLLLLTAMWSFSNNNNSYFTLGILVYFLLMQTLDFSLDERLSLADLTLALDNELLVSGNGIHQAALISYKDEIQFLRWVFDTYIFNIN